MKERKNDIWLKAAVAGSLWASVEIVVGSFLHNLRVPLAGTILAVMGLSLMIAFQYKWNDKGLIWRAGLIAALMKSLSPSAIILGPMVGILTEAFLLDLCLRLLGRNPLAYLTGSVIAVLSALFHKVFTIIMLYGFHIVTILENMYHYAERQLKVEGPDPVKLLIYLLLLYFIFGIFAASIGIMAGKMIKRKNALPFKDKEASIQPGFSISGERHYSLGWLLFHFVVLTGGLFLINKFSLILSAIPLIPYLVFVIVKYKQSLRRLAKPVFWIQMIVILLVAVFFWNEYATGQGLQAGGFMIGLQMVFRALLVVMAFTAISVELRNPVVKAVLYKRGFSRFYTAMGLAFSVLPEVMSRLAKPVNLIFRPVRSLSMIILYSDNIYRNFLDRLTKGSRVFLISGDQREGKTTFLKKAVALFDKKNIPVGGLIASGIDNQGVRNGFSLLDIASYEKILLCQIEEKPGWEKTGKYYFNPEGLKFGLSKLNHIPRGSLVVVDEIGPLELGGKGWSSSLQRFLEEKRQIMIWVVRRNLIEQVIRYFDLHNVRIFDIAKYTPDELVERINGEPGL